MTIDPRTQRIDKIIDELRQLKEEIVASTSAASRRVSEKDLDSLDWKPFTPGRNGTGHSSTRRVEQNFERISNP